MSWLITGGAGYIGSHLAKLLDSRNQEVVILDDLSTGKLSRIPSPISFVHASVLDYQAVLGAINSYGVKGIIHLAAKKSVEDSFRETESYFRTNVDGLKTVRDAAIASNIKRFIFSSTAAVYDSDSISSQLTERSPLGPTNPYGASKLEAEKELLKIPLESGFRSIIFRYFNVVGYLDSSLREHNAKNLIPIIEKSLLNGDTVPIFGDKLDTKDGTCIRDYIHIEDICSAHLKAIKVFDNITRTENLVLNLGTGIGYSVFDVIKQIELKTGKSVKWRAHPPRTGDPTHVVCDPSKAQDVLNWIADRNPFI